MLGVYGKIIPFVRIKGLPGPLNGAVYAVLLMILLFSPDPNRAPMFPFVFLTESLALRSDFVAIMVPDKYQCEYAPYPRTSIHLLLIFIMLKSGLTSMG